MCYSGSNRSAWSAAGYWWLHARHELADIVDAVAPGGSGDPFATPTTREREALAAVLRHGYPRGALSQLWQFAPWVWNLLTQAESSPYFTDFWTKTGFLGHDEPERLSPFLIDIHAKVARVLKVTEIPVATLSTRLATAGAVSDMIAGITLDIEVDDPTKFFGARIEFLSGKAKGRVVPCTQVEGSVLMTSIESHAELFAGVEAGDEVHITNREFVAWCHLFLHQLDLSEDGQLEREWGGLKAWMVDGRPLYPQVLVVGPRAGGGPRGHTGAFTGKVIHINTTHDSMVWPNGAIGWTHKIEQAQGENRHERYRLWWIENSPHGEPDLLLPAVTAQKDGKRWKAELVSYHGATSQALRDLSSFAEVLPRDGGGWVCCPC
jgi:hypothetical protein